MAIAKRFEHLYQSKHTTDALFELGWSKTSIVADMPDEQQQIVLKKMIEIRDREKEADLRRKEREDSIRLDRCSCGMM